MTRIGWIGTCPTPYCGRIEGFFCVRCRIYTSDCACKYNWGGCRCNDKRWWASKGERKQLTEDLAKVLA